MKKALLFILIFSLTIAITAFKYFKPPTDDTATLQGYLGANATLPAHHGTYFFSTALNLTHNLNLNGNELRWTPTTGVAITITGNGVKIYNGKLTGQNGYVYNPSIGNAGIQMSGTNDTVANMNINTFTSSGILGGKSDGNTVLADTISKTGYVACFLITDSNNPKLIAGGTIAFNVFDRSMLSNTVVTQPALILRGLTNYQSSGWNVHHNIIKMPLKPTDISAEDCEMRFTNNSSFWANTCIGGSIGISVVANQFNTVALNNCTQQNLEGIEFANSQFNWCQNNIVQNQYQFGILVDGFAPTGNIGNKFLNNVVSNTASYGFKFYGISYNSDMIGNTVSNCGTASVYFQLGAYWLNMYNNTFDGVSKAGAQAVIIDSSPGQIIATGNTFKNFPNKTVKFYIHPSAGVSIKADNVIFTANTYVNTVKGYNSDLGTGGSLGTSISIN